VVRTLVFDGLSSVSAERRSYRTGSGSGADRVKPLILGMLLCYNRGVESSKATLSSLEQLIQSLEVHSK